MSFVRVRHEPIALPARLRGTLGFSIRWLVKSGDSVEKHQLLAEIGDRGPTHANIEIRSPAKGILRGELPNGEIANALIRQAKIGSDVPIASVEMCVHAIVYEGLCTSCGADTTTIDHLEMEEVTSRTIGGKHQLKIANHVFDDLVRQNSQTLLKARKLVLVLDLDHTLLHASHDSRAKDLLGHEEFKDTLHEVFLAQGHTGHHYIKLRPYAREFIHNLQKYYDIRIFTWGLRHYAERVVELLDPEDKIIHSKIVSRDDMGLGDVKTVQQKDFTRIFPCDDEMVIVIDDDPRVWASAQENLLTIPKYEFFPSGEYAHGGKTSAADQSVKWDPKNLLQKNDENILQSYERLLLVIHSLYYRYHEENSQILDTKFLLRFIKSKILSDVNILFSGVFPHETPFHLNREVVLSQEYGAKVSEDFESGTSRTTHLVCARKHTEKHKKAIEQNLFIVSPKWFWMSIFHFKRMDELEFTLDAFSSDRRGYYSNSLIDVAEMIDSTSDALDQIVSHKRKLSEEEEKQFSGDQDELSDHFDDIENYEDDDSLSPARKKLKSDEEKNENELTSDSDDSLLRDLEAEIEADFEDNEEE